MSQLENFKKSKEIPDEHMGSLLKSSETVNAIGQAEMTW